jgi:hypothetical protein
MGPSLSRKVRRRAGATCEYCRMPQAFDPIPFEVDHVIAEQHGGATSLENLALACAHCNRHKGPNLSGIDPHTGRLVRLYHPRRDHWARHFTWAGPVLLGRTASGRATIAVLAINHPDAVAVRAELIEEGVFPPASPRR